MHAVAEWPESFVREPEVVAALLVSVEPDASEAVPRIGGWHVQSVPRVDDSLVGGAGAVCHPYTGAGLHQRFQRGHESTAGAADGDRAVRRAIVSKRLAVGEHDHRL